MQAKVFFKKSFYDEANDKFYEEIETSFQKFSSSGKVHINMNEPELVYIVYYLEPYQCVTELMDHFFFTAWKFTFYNN
jgi:hypothetical protein